MQPAVQPAQPAGQTTDSLAQVANELQNLRSLATDALANEKKAELLLLQAEEDKEQFISAQ